MRTLFLLIAFLASHSVLGSLAPEIKNIIVSFANKQDHLNLALVSKERYLPARCAGGMKEKMLALAQDPGKWSQPWAQGLLREINEFFDSGSSVDKRFSVCKGWNLPRLRPVMNDFISPTRLSILLKDVVPIKDLNKKLEITRHFSGLGNQISDSTVLNNLVLLLEQGTYTQQPKISEIEDLRQATQTAIRAGIVSENISNAWFRRSAQFPISDADFSLIQEMANPLTLEKAREFWSHHLNPDQRISGNWAFTSPEMIHRATQVLMSMGEKGQVYASRGWLNLLKQDPTRYKNEAFEAMGPIAELLALVYAEQKTFSAYLDSQQIFAHCYTQKALEFLASQDAEDQYGYRSLYKKTSIQVNLEKLINCQLIFSYPEGAGCGGRWEYGTAPLEAAEFLFNLGFDLFSYQDHIEKLKDGDCNYREKVDKLLAKIQAQAKKPA